MDETNARLVSPSADLIGTLAPRELECLRGVTEHKRSAQIAHELNLQPKTVDAYLANAARKLGVSDRASAARLLVAHEQALGGKSLSDFSGVEPPPDLPSISWASRLPWPFPTSKRPTNDLTFPQLLLAIGFAAAALMLVATLYLSAIALLSRNL